MKGSSQGRHASSNQGQTAQQPTSGRATNANQKMPSSMQPSQPTISTRKSSASRSGVHHQHSKSSTTATGTKSRQNGGGSISGHRASLSSSAAQPGQRDSSIPGHKTGTAYAQYGLISGQSHKDQIQPSSGTPPYQGGQNQTSGTSSSNLKSAKAVMGNIQIHQKTKSTHLPSSHGYVQMQGGANEGYVIYANANNSGQTTSSGTSTKLAMKHSRHQSNPSRIILQGGAQGQPQTGAKISNGMYDASLQHHHQQNLNMAKTGNSGEPQPSSSQANSKPRSKQINQSSTIVGASQIHPGHQRLNSGKFGTHVNTSKIQKVQVSGSGDNSNVTYSVNTSGSAMGTSGISNGKSTATAGHKKSSSMANSKITQLLLKAGNKHYVQQNLQAASVLNQHQHAAMQGMRPGLVGQPALVQGHQQPQSIPQQSLPQKQRIQTAHGHFIGNSNDQQQEQQEYFVSSYDVPRRSTDLLHDAQRLPISTNLVVSGINKSMDMAQSQLTAVNIDTIQQHQGVAVGGFHPAKQISESQADQHLQRILQVEQQMDQPTKTEQTYQEHLSKYLIQNSSQPSNSGGIMTHQSTGTDPNTNTRLKEAANSLEPQSKPSSIEMQYKNGQQQEFMMKHGGNAMALQQQAMYSQQMLANTGIGAVQNVQHAQTGQKSAINAQAVEKITRQGKVVSSGSISVKKPSSNHVKNVSAGAHKPSQTAAHSHMNSNAGSSLAKHQQKSGQQGAHQRTKSDMVGSEFALLINMGKVIQNQKGKVGEILKNNFIEAQQPHKQSALPGSMPQTSGKAPPKMTMNIAKQMRTYTGGDRSKQTSDNSQAVQNDFSQAAALHHRQVTETTGIAPSKLGLGNASLSQEQQQHKHSSSSVSNMIPQSISKQNTNVAGAQKNSKSIQQKYQELESKYNELLEQLESKNSDGTRKYSPIDQVAQQQLISNNQASLSSLSSKNTSQGVGARAPNQPQKQHASTFQDNTQMNPRMIRYINNQMKMNKGSGGSGANNQLLEAQALNQQQDTTGGSKKGRSTSNKQVNSIEQTTQSSKFGVSSGGIIDTRSADTNIVKQQQKIDLSQMTITHPFEDQAFSMAPPNSQQVSGPHSSTASQQFAAIGSRRGHNRVNTHYFGQQMVESATNKNAQAQVPNAHAAGVTGPEFRLHQNSTANLTREELANHQKMLANKQQDGLQKTKISNHGHSHSHGHGSQALKSMQGVLIGQSSTDRKILKAQGKGGAISQIENAVSQTLQTPRTMSQSQEQVEMLAALQRQQEMSRMVAISNETSKDGVQPQKGVTRHTRMLLQSSLNQEDAHGNNAFIRVEDTNKYSNRVSSGGHHRRSVSDGNDPGSFNFKQQQHIVTLQADAGHESKSGSQEPPNAAGKQTLARYSMQHRKRLDQSQGNRIIKGATRSQSRSKKQEQQEMVNTLPHADVSSLESADHHHHPNQQLLFAQVAQERKSVSKKVAKANDRSQGQTVLTKDSYHAKKVSHVKKTSKNLTGASNFEKRSVSKGATASTRHEMHKKAHGRMKSNSYRVANKDSSLVSNHHKTGSAAANAPSNEGQIQNPANVVLSGRFIEMAQNQAGQIPSQKVVIKRVDDVQFGQQNPLSIDLNTKEQHAKQLHLQNAQASGKASEGGNSKRAFHHPALSQPSNAWMKAQTSHDMFIVQEDTPISLQSSNEHKNSDQKEVYPFIQVRKGPNAVGLSPVMHHKKGIGLNQKPAAQDRLTVSQGSQLTRDFRHYNAAPSSDISKSDLRQKSGLSGIAGAEVINPPGKKALQIEKKRVGISKNQATNHPICQPHGVAHHVKNKLSNHSDQRQTELTQMQVVTQGSNHKRHKSDIVESQRQNFQPLLVTSMGQLGVQAAESKVPQKGKKTKKKEIKTAQISPNMTTKQGLSLHLGHHDNQVIMGTDEFYAAKDQVDDRKMVNISIDDLNDELPSDGEAIGGLNSMQQKHGEKSRWIEVRRNDKDMQEETPLLQFADQEANPPKQSLSGSHKERDRQVNEKRKKYMQQYQMKSEVLEKSIQGVSGRASAAAQNEHTNEILNSQYRSKNSLLKKRQSNPTSAMLIEEPNSTEESLQHDTSQPGSKFKNIMNIAKRKFKSKSQVPSHVEASKHSHKHSLERDMKQERHQKQHSNASKLGQYQGIPVDTQENKVNINLNIPSAIKGISEKGAIHAHPNSITQRSLADSDQQLSRVKQMQVQQVAAIDAAIEASNEKNQKGQKSNDKDSTFVPVNSLEIQNYRVLSSQTPQSNKLQAPKASVQKNNFIPSLSPAEKDGSPGMNATGDLRIETYSSIEHDSELTAKEKIRKKISKYIRTAFQTTGQVPRTTVDFYRIGKILGKGAFGKVNLAVHHLTSQMVAIKSINKQYFSDDAQRRKVLHEVVVLKQTRHKHIVRLFEYFETQKHFLFVIEIAPGGDLLSYVRKRRQLKEEVAKSVFKQIISGLNYCHSKGVLHRDIKLDNILLSASGEVKICDFGVSKIIKRGQVMTEQCGTPAYIAPEILRDRGYEGFGVDIWSSGVVLYAMLYGIVPFRATHMAELQKLIMKAEYKLQDCISKDARDMLSGLLEKDPTKRLTVKQILGHPWMADAKDSVELFTQAEKNYIKSEYTYVDKSRYNRNTGGTQCGLEYESDAFVDALLDTEEKPDLKNAETKSIILAPFNSTKSHIETGEEFLEQVREELLDRRVIKFAPRVREIAKQYEVNNNAELDNGVQHDFLEEEAKNKAAQEEKKRAADVDELDALDDGRQSGMKLDQLIKNEESLQLSGEGRRVDPYKNENADAQTERIQNGQATNSSSLNPLEIGEARNSLAPGVIPTQETLIVDEPILEDLIEYGYPRAAVIQYLNKNELNNATSAYWLLQMAAEQQAAEEAASAAAAAGKPEGGKQRKQMSASVSEH